MTLLAERFDLRERNQGFTPATGEQLALEHSDAPYVGLDLSAGTYGVRVGPEVREVNVCKLDNRYPQRPQRMFKLDTVSETTDGGIILSGEVGIKRGNMYGISVDGSNVIYADPYAEEVQYFQSGKDQRLDLVSVAVPKTPFDYSGPRLAIDDLRIYEANVKGLTALHPDLPKGQRGTYAGLGKVIPHHLVDIGMNGIQLLPVTPFNPKNSFAVERGLTDYWGYNPDAFSAPHPLYSATGRPGPEVQSTIRAFHKEGIAFGLDLVYNHTGLDSRSGIGAALRALNKNAFHRNSEYSGVGESPNLGDPMVLNLVLDSIRSWISRGVDFIRYDLATTLMRDANGDVTMDHPFIRAMSEDPILKGHTMIAEPWDMGPYGYQVDNIGQQRGWKEWDNVQQAERYNFWRGMGTAGQSEHNAKGRGNPSGKVSYLTAHDGFTLHQSVTYLAKDNTASKQNNANGTDDNFWNSGFEGLTDNVDVLKLRRRRMMSMYLDLVLTNTDIMVRADDMRANDANNDRWSLDQPNSWKGWADEDIDAKLVVDFRTAAMRWRVQSDYFGVAANTSHMQTGRPLGVRQETSYNVWGLVMADKEKGSNVIGQGLSDSFHRRDAFIAYKNGSHADLVGDNAVTLPDDGEYEVIFNTAEDTGMPAKPTTVRGKLEVPALSVVLIKKIR